MLVEKAMENLKINFGDKNLPKKKLWKSSVKNKKRNLKRWKKKMRKMKNENKLSSGSKLVR